MEENTRKVTPWKVIKWTFLSISFLVYLLVFVRLFFACDADISDDIILTSHEVADFENMDVDYPLFNYQPSSWTNEEGTLQIKNIYYVQPINELQLTVRYRISAFETDENSEPFSYSIRVTDKDGIVESETPLYAEDLEGTVAQDLKIYSQRRYNYRYVRLCASEVTVDDGVKRTERTQIVDEDGNVTYGTKTVTEGGNKVYLDVYDSQTEELLYSFVVAGKTVGGVRTRRNKVDVRIED